MTRTRACVAAAAAAALLTVTSCGSDDSPERNAKPATSHTANTAEDAADSETVKGISDRWQRKLEALDTDAAASCNDPGATQCADDLTRIMELAHQLETQLEENGGRAQWPETTAQLQAMQKATDLYVEHECEGDPNAGIDGAQCYGHTLKISMGPAMLANTLVIDEAKQ